MKERGWTCPASNYNGEVKLNYSVRDDKGVTAGNNSFVLEAVNDAPELTGITAKLETGQEDVSYRSRNLIFSKADRYRK